MSQAENEKDLQAIAAFKESLDIDPKNLDVSILHYLTIYYFFCNVFFSCLVDFMTEIGMNTMKFDVEILSLKKFLIPARHVKCIHYKLLCYTF